MIHALVSFAGRQHMRAFFSYWSPVYSFKRSLKIVQVGSRGSFVFSSRSGDLSFKGNKESVII
ncbi:hypothetical protein PAECIP111890_00620 [Paenibacillus sp. JJ-223]|nr:hypothetical protein PAECIP111890_00620 [Paenibacillus sp. JJ-223]